MVEEILHVTSQTFCMPSEMFYVSSYVEQRDGGSGCFTFCEGGVWIFLYAGLELGLSERTVGFCMCSVICEV